MTGRHEFVRPGQVSPDWPAPDRCMVCGESRGAHYHAAVTEAENDVRDALSHVRAEEDAGRITPLQAANERVALLERHLARLAGLRIKYLGGQP